MLAASGLKPDGLTSIVGMTFHVPIGVRILGIVRFVAGHLHLLESPLRQNRIRRSQIASQIFMSQSQSRRQGVNAASFIIPSVFLHIATAFDVIYHLDNPVIMFIANSLVAVPRNFPV